MISCSSLMLLTPGILPIFWSIPFVIHPKAKEITGKVSVHIPHIPAVSISRTLYFESFSMCFGWMLPIHLWVATPVSMVLHHYIRLVHWQFPIHMYLDILENCDFFVFHDHLGLVFIPPLRDFNTAVPAHPPMDICSCLLLLLLLLLSLLLLLLLLLL